MIRSNPALAFVLLTACFFLGGCDSEVVRPNDPYESARQLIANCQREQATELVIRTPVSAELLPAIFENTQLQTLELYQSHFTPSDLGDLATLLQLRRLRLEDMPLDDATLQRLAPLSKLEILNIPASALTDAGLQTLASQAGNLRLLRFGSPHVSDGGIAALRQLTSLRFLHLIQTSITDAGLVHFHSMHELESFYVDGGQETEAGIRELLQANPKLHFHRNQLHIADDPNAD